MFKTLLILSIFLSACSSAEALPTDLTGTWTTDDRSDIEMTADIQSESIVIDWVDDNAHALYWKGSFAETAKDGDTILSAGDTEAMASSLLGSLDDSKEFTYEDTLLRFELTIMGVTQTIWLDKE